jgi:hypothetical protein
MRQGSLRDTAATKRWVGLGLTLAVSAAGAQRGERRHHYRGLARRSHGLGLHLHDAITAANTNAVVAGSSCAAGSGTADTISFNLPNPSTITLAGALPAITGNLDIQGPGASQLTVSGNDAVRVFEVGPGHTVSIGGITIAHGLCGPCAHGDEGGGLYNAGTLGLSGVVLTQNTASASGGTNTFPEGGGILNQGTLTLTLSTVSSNTASPRAARRRTRRRAAGSSTTAP